MRGALASSTFLVVLMGCASTSRHDGRIQPQSTPPSPSFLQQWQNADAQQLEALVPGDKEQNLAWWKKYRLAQIHSKVQPATACTHYRELSADTAFPLHELALLRSHQVCPQQAAPPLPEKITVWYRPLYIDIKLQESEDWATLQEKARAESNLKKKEEVLLRALEFAKKNKNAQEIATTEKLLHRVSPRFIPEPTPRELVSVANDFRQQREFTKALSIYKKVLKLKTTTVEEKFLALKGIRQTYKIMEKKNDYVMATADLANWARKQHNQNKTDHKAVARFHDAQLLLVRTVWTEGQVSRALKILNETQRMLKGLYPMDEVYFIEGRIEEEKKNFETAIEYYEASYKEPVSSPGLQDKILWLKSWNYFKLQKYPEAIKSFTQMHEQTQDNSDKARARFWLARTYQLTGKPEQAKSELQKLTQEDPLGYYGLLAYRELQSPMPPLSLQQKDSMPLTMLSVSEVDANTRLTVEWLISVNEKEFLEKILNDVVKDLQNTKVTREDAWLTVSSTYARAGLYLNLFAALGGLSAEVKETLLNSHPDLLFPIPYTDLVRDASVKSGTPAAFIYSIMRQESAFNPEVRSHVHAMGLMQLMPRVAQNIAREFKLPLQETEDLFKPEINIPLGAFELKKLIQRYDQQFILASAAYNASDKAIRGWLQSRFRNDPLEFIEEVPYEETRTYIKLVMRNYAFYERLLNQGQATPFPEKLLRFSQNETATR